ncbi:MAG: hypothetical protein VYE68_06375, partial [Acidobacteriota bacterium]|nr:hypothetical protein [Acidobacteriota bacterium]
TGVLGVPVFGQDEPVYPVYDGFHVTDEGLYVLSYAYFSHNFEPVTVPVGPDNRFESPMIDRQQPVTFLPGHHRFQCVMVWGPGFDRELRWTVNHAGVTTTTSDDMLQYNWELEAGSLRNVLRDIDPSAVPQGVCLNRSPTVRFLGLRSGPEGAAPELVATLGRPLKLFGSTRDEGLPRAGTLEAQWRVLSGPGVVTFSAPDEPRTLASFDTPGVYKLELWANDGEKQGTNQVIVSVEPER